MSEDKTAISPYCRDLRSKKFYRLERPPRDEGDILDASNWCWCARTDEALGPDDYAAEPEECQQGRKCFRPYGAR